MPKRTSASTDLWRVVCDLLNGDTPIPTERRLPPAPKSGLLWAIEGFGMRRDIVSAARVAREEVSRHMEERLRLQIISADDVEWLRQFHRTRLRYYCRPPSQKLGPDGKPQAFSDLALSAALRLWPPKPSLAEWKAANEKVVSHFLPFMDAIDAIGDSFGWDHARRFVLGLLLSVPQTLEATYLCLLAEIAAYVWPEGRKERLAPCLACDRFFIASRSDARTCSEKCRQVVRQDQVRKDPVEAGRRREKDRERKRVERDALKGYEAQHGVQTKERRAQLLAAGRRRLRPHTDKGESAPRAKVGRGKK